MSEELGIWERGVGNLGIGNWEFGSWGLKRQRQQSVSASIIKVQSSKF